MFLNAVALSEVVPTFRLHVSLRAGSGEDRGGAGQMQRSRDVHCPGTDGRETDRCRALCFDSMLGRNPSLSDRE